jgi:cyclopropane fatty-acyl-phospholipid synthase-like methyltransferase
MPRVAFVAPTRIPCISKLMSSPTRKIVRRTTTTQSHYEAHSTDSYEGAFFYEPGAYTEYLQQLVRERLGIKVHSGKPLRLLDVGGGTGNFTHMIVRDTKTTAIVVDPFLAQHDSLVKDQSQLGFVTSSAEIFMEMPTQENKWWRTGYHKVLLKEVVHHFTEGDRVPIFRGIRHGFSSATDISSNTPAILLITRPQRDIDYPLWDAAREVWAENQPSVEQLAREMREAGFHDIRYTTESYPCTIPLSKWQEMVRNRFWSTFSNFTDEQLDDACKSIEKDGNNRLDDQGLLHFEDRLIFISADH